MDIVDTVSSDFDDPHSKLQKLEEKARKAEEALDAEQKVRKELEGLNSKLLAEKTALLDSLAGEKGSLQEYQEKSAKLQAQKNDLDNQLRVSFPKHFFFFFNLPIDSVESVSVFIFQHFLFHLKFKIKIGYTRTFITRRRCPQSIVPTKEKIGTRMWWFEKRYRRFRIKCAKNRSR